ncbi:hypothetical protein FSP39_020414 [Pinctada imbricata]|uniref:Cadherin domain-containing protein n=1 Tax=Pinctada imbricata TaxID=66713 RepID=A0AA88YKB4_PINIB|nr:hypothetical protein FSP39_020414 [Pinctada imbricata]
MTTHKPTRPMGKRCRLRTAICHVSSRRYYSGGTMLPYTDCSGQTDCPQMTLHANGPGELRENYKYDWDNAGTILSNRAYSLRFYFTKNTELVFSKTSYNASIPNHWTIGKSVLTLGLSGVDYAEVATYTMIAHTNGSDGLFDIDRFGTVKIAGVLPTGYDDESVFIYTVSAVDYCQNYANTTLTIETFNSPPLFGNLPSLIEIEETVGVSQSLFPVIVSDPTNDSICCTLEKTLPQSENFILDLDRSFFIATSKKAYFSYNLINSYLVRICCQDRNFSTSSVLQVKIKKEETNSNIPVPGWVVTSLIISSVPIGLLVLTSCTLLFFMVFGLT